MSSTHQNHRVEELSGSLDWRRIDANEAMLIRSFAIALLVSEPDFDRWQHGDRPVPFGSDPFALELEHLRMMSSEHVRSYTAFLLRHIALAYKGTFLWIGDRNYSEPGTPAHVLSSLRALRP